MSETTPGQQWDWLADTYWYVPEANLLAYVVDAEAGKRVAVNDQTVFHVTSYDAGYFWGTTVVQLGDQPRCRYALFGSVTPRGNVLLTFTPTDAGPRASVTQGVGVMVEAKGGAAMLNQMASGPGVRMQVSHWAYMLQTRPGEPSWSSLPGVGVSVPEFLDVDDGQGRSPES